MDLEKLRNGREKILECHVKDANGLNDFQKLPSTHEREIPEVGIERYRLPLRYERMEGEALSHDSQASMYVFLEGYKTGVNMSRFCTILQEQGDQYLVNNLFIKDTLTRYRTELRDAPTDQLIPTAHLKLQFNFPVKQKSLKSDNWGWQYYPCEFYGVQNADNTIIELKLNYEYSSTCPSSLSLAKQYENDYREGNSSEGNGIAAAHGQRSLATCTVKYFADADFKIEDLIALLRKALPTETQSLVKRVDEQAFAILNGQNPMFVEHAGRRLSVTLDADIRLLDWTVKIEHFESLHSHNAVATIRKIRH